MTEHDIKPSYYSFSLQQFDEAKTKTKTTTTTTATNQ
jgi:hypothetical protein